MTSDSCPVLVDLALSTLPQLVLLSKGADHEHGELQRHSLVELYTLSQGWLSGGGFLFHDLSQSC